MRIVVSNLSPEPGLSFASLAGIVEGGSDGVSALYANILLEMSTELALGVAAFVAVMVIFVVMRARGPAAAKATSSTSVTPFFPPPPKNPPLRPDQIVLRLDRQKNREPGPTLVLPRRPSDIFPSPAAASLRDVVREAPAVPEFQPTRTSSASERGSAGESAVAPFPAAAVGVTAGAAVAPALSVELLRHLEWKRFEMLVQRYYEAGGMRVTCTPAVEGVGIDLHICRGEETQPCKLVHCHAGEGRPVQLEAVTALSAQTVGAAAEVVFVTSGNFSPGAQAYAQTKRITLITGDTLAARFNAVSAPQRAGILAEVMAGDYTTPTCRHCNLKMILPVAVEGQVRAWSCPSAPRCAFTLPLRLS